MSVCSHLKMNKININFILVAAIAIGGLVAVGAASAFGVTKASTYMALHPSSKLATSKIGVSLTTSKKVVKM